MRRYGRPIVATSCNFSGEEPITDIKDIPPKIRQSVDLIVDDGESKLKMPSTIIKVENEEVLVLRLGTITKEEINKKIGED